jgi:hypothetical protein
VASITDSPREQFYTDAGGGQAHIYIGTDQDIYEMWPFLQMLGPLPSR